VWIRVLLAALCAACAQCASRPAGPLFHDEQYLRFGVDPRHEADSLIKLYKEQSERLALRLVGRDFTALGFMDREGRSTRTRVITQLGIALALDPVQPSPLSAATRYALVAPPLPDTHDVDRDGFEEVFVERREAAQTCLLVFRVRDVGYVDAVPVQQQLFGQARCPTGLSDVNRDGKVELVVDVDLVDFVLETPPALRVVLWPEQHRFVLDTADHKLAQYVAAQQAAREIELEQARSVKDVATCLRLAVELAALTHLLGLPPRDQVARFERALTGVDLRAPQRAWAESARAHMEQTWTEPPRASAPPASAPSAAKPDAGAAPATRPSTLAEPGAS
jgi:hypothetical protein